MSVICRTDKGWVISHYDYTKKIYTNVVSHSGEIDLTCDKNLFHILTPLMRDQEARNFIKNLTEKEFVISQEMKTKKRSRSATFDHEIRTVQLALKELKEIAQTYGYFTFTPARAHYAENNSLARKACKAYNSESCANECFSGGNTTTSAIIVRVREKDYVIPRLCSFVCCQIENINSELCNKKFDFILLDPPWWNKFIRRKKAKMTSNGYSMLNNRAIQDIPISTFLNEFGLVGVWCTNAPSHIEAVVGQFFVAWGLKYVSTWYWVKVTKSGELVCPFRGDTEKRPYERLIFGCAEGRKLKNPEPEKCIVSVPSAIHSHKPPLVEILQEYLPENPACLELFARYLLPGWTSVGNQVLDLQCISLFDIANKSAVSS